MSTVREIARVLMPGGLLLLTMDLGIEGNAELKPDAFRGLMEWLEEKFEWVVPQRTVHPLRVLTSQNSPYRHTQETSKWAKLVSVIKKREFKRLTFAAKRKLRSTRKRAVPTKLACMGMVLRKT